MAYKFYIEIPKITDQSFEYKAISSIQVKITVPGNYASQIPDKIAIGGIIYDVTNVEYLGIGSNEVENGNFSDLTGGIVIGWNHFDGIDIPDSYVTGGKLSLDPFHNSGPNVVLDPLKTYTLSFDVSSNSSGITASWLNDVSLIGFQEFAIDGTFEITITGANRIYFTANDVASIDNVSVKEYNDSTILTLDTASLTIGSEGTFYLVDNWTEVVEPIGFDGFQYTLARSEQYSGVENIFSETDLTWEYPHSIPFTEIFESEGFDAQRGFKFVDCNGSEIVGVLNFIWYVQNGKDVSLKMEGDPLDRKFLNRIETSVTLDNPIGLDGNSININPYFIKVHNKRYVQQGKYLQSGSDVTSPTTDATGYFCYPPINPEVTEILGEYNPGGFFLPFTGGTSGIPDYFNFKADVAGTYQIRGRCKGVLTGKRDFGDGNINLSIKIFYGASITTGFSEISLVNEASVNASSGYSFNIDFDTNITLNANDYLVLRTFSNPDEFFELTFSFDEVYLDIIAAVDYPSSNVRGFDMFDAFRIAAESITGETGIFKSSILEDGCLSNIHLTNGYNIRRMLQKDNTSFAINASFKDLFTYINSFMPIGFRFQNEDGQRVLRLEAIEYFYNNTEVVRFDDVDTFRRSVAGSKLYNEIEIGYDKYADESLNGLDEFNTKHSYTIPLKNIKQKKTLINPVITSGYVIESGRRIQFSTNPSQDWNFDSNNFLIQKNRIQVTSDLYGDGAGSYPPGFVSERNELIAVANVFSPETSYNLRFTPARAMINWLPVTSVSGPVMKFRSGDINIQLITLDNSVCSNYFGNLYENADIDIVNTLASKLHGTNYLEFEYPIDIDTFNLIEANSNTLFSVSYCDVEFKGYLIECKYQPLAQSGSLGIFKLIEAVQCTPGAFSDGFSSGFQIGSC